MVLNPGKGLPDNEDSGSDLKEDADHVEDSQGVPDHLETAASLEVIIFGF